MLWKRIAYISLLFFKFSGGMAPLPYRFKPLALKLTETCRAMSQSNFLFSIIVGASFDEAVLPRAILRIRRAHEHFNKRLARSLVKLHVPSVGTEAQIAYNKRDNTTKQ